MIHFFSKLRKSLFERNQISKYIAYALGEIVLVMIGILLALQVNTWNSERQEEKQMDAFLQGILEDLKSDTVQFQYRVRFFRSHGEKLKSVLTRSDFSDISADSLVLILRPRIADYVLNSSTFDKIATTGITQISSNDSLSGNIYMYYTNVATNLKSTMDWDRDGSTEAANYLNFGPNLVEINLEGYPQVDTDSILNLQDEATRKMKLVQLLSEPIGRNHFKLAYARKIILANRMLEFSNRASMLIKEIENELANKGE